MHPRTAGVALPTWVGAGGNPNSVVRAARHGLNLVLAIIGGTPSRFVKLSELFRQAVEEYWKAYSTFALETRHERGFPEITREYYEKEVLRGSIHVGSPETVAHRIARTMTVLGTNRFDLEYGMGPMPHSSILRTIRLFGTQVAPLVRQEPADRTTKETS
ncbi:hypothetical protein [Streptomyces sp. NPDC058653]|uniref:hypothetical protein n=1 Tax=Streptomyces sp. NPDC058653 TaxID=3346576 RepID=UPI00365242E4